MDTITKNIGPQTFQAKNAIPTVKFDGRNIMIVGECFVANGTASLLHSKEIKKREYDRKILEKNLNYTGYS